MKNIASQADIILNPDGSVYHLCVQKERLSKKVILVGDPDRVEKVLQFMEHPRIVARHREFITGRGTYKGAEITVVSTGIGTDNIDIVLNELDMAWNLVPGTRSYTDVPSALEILRIGTCGGTGMVARPGSFVMSDHAIGLDGLGLFYRRNRMPVEEVLRTFLTHKWPELEMPAYVSAVHPSWKLHVGATGGVVWGNTLTSTGFYAPQGRRTGRYQLVAQDWVQELAGPESPLPVSNLEMETAAIYLLAELLGHKAASLSVVLANRDMGEFSADPEAEVNRLIQYGLECIASFCG